MKRCPQCDFTFEDYRQFCDFDGTELTAIPQAISGGETLSTARAESPACCNDLQEGRTTGAVRPLLFRRFSRSRSALAALALAGVTLGALLIGYYDSTSQRVVEMASIDPNHNVAAPSASETREPNQVAKSRNISTQRRIKDDEKVSSMPGSLLRSPSETSRLRSSKSRPGPQTSKLQANTRSNEKAVGRLQARNQKRHSREFGRADKKESKVVAILKKTGSILTKPFRL